MKIPILINGKPYCTQETREIRTYDHGEKSDISIASPVHVNRALHSHHKNLIDALSIRHILQIFAKAGGIFSTGNLNINGASQSPSDYCENLCRYTGNPYKIGKDMLSRSVQFMGHIEDILVRQSFGFPLDIYDSNIIQIKDICTRWVPASSVLGVVLSDNLPFINFFWLIALALKYPVLIRPAWNDPFTPLRLVYSLIEAGMPREVLSYIPCDYDGVNSMVNSGERVILFGSDEVKSRFSDRRNVRVFGPGRSKIYVGPDEISRTGEIADLAADSMANNGGKGCVNASMLIVPEKKGREIALMVAERLNRIGILDPMDGNAAIPAVKSENTVLSIRGQIGAMLQAGGRNMTSASEKDSDIVMSAGGTSYFRPTVILTDRYGDVFNRELPFPFLVVAEANDNDALKYLDHSLAVTAITGNKAFLGRLMKNHSINKVYVGFQRTDSIDYAEPHEGYLTSFLYAEKALRLETAL